MRKYQLTLISFFISVGILFAQSDLKIYQWKSHLPYDVGKSITQSSTKVYFASPFSIFSVDKEEQSLDFLTKVEGLSDIKMSVLKYAPEHETLIACYANSNIDLIKPDGIVNLPDVKNFDIVGDRAIYNIYQATPDLFYLSCGFGVVELNVDREEFGFTANFGIKVSDITIFEGNFYAATEEGVYRILNGPSANPQNTGEWKLLGPEDGFHEDYSSEAIVVYNNKLYVDVNDTLFQYNEGVLEYVHYEEDHEIIYITAEGEHMLVGEYCRVNGTDCTGKVLFFDKDHSFETSGSGCVNRPYYAIEDEKQNVWFSDRWRNVRLASNYMNDCIPFNINAPYSEHATEIVIDDGNLWLATETPGAGNDFGYYSLTEGQWDYYNNRSHPLELKDLTTCYRIAVHPENKKVYVGSYDVGLLEMDGDKFTFYNDTNSPLATGADPERIRVGGLAFDNDKNLWISNNSAQNPIVVYKNDGTWQNDFSTTSKGLRQVVIDNSGNKWFTVDGGSQGVVIFNEGNLEDPNDDQVRILNTSNSQLPINIVNSLAVDLDGDVWVGTNEGVVVFECGSNVFDPNCQGSKRIVQVDGFNAYLLETEIVTTIAVDGANRKWFGTKNGIFVQSPSGEEQVAFFDKDNSPLFDNSVTDIAIDPSIGEVFIGTTSGLISLRYDATEGQVVNSNNVYAFPNPVRPDYSGPIAIKGLARDANVKITDINGQRVYETTALGGQAIWDGKDYNGKRASSGVYLVFSTSTQQAENPDAIVTKILFIN
jgi:ligand-binding sensor domain-containing protein